MTCALYAVQDLDEGEKLLGSERERRAKRSFFFDLYLPAVDRHGGLERRRARSRDGAEQRHPPEQAARVISSVSPPRRRQ